MSENRHELSGDPLVCYFVSHILKFPHIKRLLKFWKVLWPMLLNVFVNLGLGFFFLPSGLLYSLITKQTEHLRSRVAWGFILLASSSLTLFRHQFFITFGSMDKDVTSWNHRSTPPVTFWKQKQDFTVWCPWKCWSCWSPKCFWGHNEQIFSTKRVNVVQVCSYAQPKKQNKTQTHMLDTKVQ